MGKEIQIDTTGGNVYVDNVSYSFICTYLRALGKMNLFFLVCLFGARIDTLKRFMYDPITN